MASELPHIPNFDLFQEPLFCTLALSTNLILKFVPIEVEQDLWRRLSFFLEKTDCFYSFLTCSKKLKLKRKFSDNRGENTSNFFHILTQFPFTTNEKKLDFFS